VYHVIPAFAASQAVLTPVASGILCCLSISEVAVHRASLILGWVTVCSNVSHIEQPRFIQHYTLHGAAK